MRFREIPGQDDPESKLEARGWRLAIGIVSAILILLFIVFWVCLVGVFLIP